LRRTTWSCAYDYDMIAVQETAAGVTFQVKVQPRAKRNAVVGELGDALKVALTAPPVEGRANEACIEFFAGLLKLPRSSIKIVSGQSSRNKAIRVTGISAEELRGKLRV
jgi:uncharacterized protein (TIGR00251 family)